MQTMQRFRYCSPRWLFSSLLLHHAGNAKESSYKTVAFTTFNQKKYSQDRHPLQTSSVVRHRRRYCAGGYNIDIIDCKKTTKKKRKRKRKEEKEESEE
ncbi:hypothetical protein PoB_003271600 [Plakobranchus ocellatus]|uniref:Secreted protein n=1 Tax=Plakobranchus ocellatus TaxID=259542 RepID=A0AAV4AHW9_9GAST|nr:hypothetical protein PoB_003271600 [Plakobranchus ocellatus]